MKKLILGLSLAVLASACGTNTNSINMDLNAPEISAPVRSLADDNPQIAGAKALIADSLEDNAGDVRSKLDQLEVTPTEDSNVFTFKVFDIITFWGTTW